jgi:hypothetical protein
VTLVLDSIFYSRLVRLVTLCGLRPITEVDARQRQRDGKDEQDKLERAAWHEGGHALLALLERIEWDGVKARSDGTGGLHHRRPVPPPAVGPELPARIALEVAGAVGESIKFSELSPASIWTDLTVALARAGVAHPEDAREGDAGVQRVRAEVKRVRELFRHHHAALACLAAALQEAATAPPPDSAVGGEPAQGGLTRPAALKLLGQVGLGVPEEPEFEWVYPPEELQRVCAAMAEVDAEKKRRSRP